MNSDDDESTAYGDYPSGGGNTAAYRAHLQRQTAEDMDPFNRPEYNGDNDDDGDSYGGSSPPRTNQPAVGTYQSDSYRTPQEMENELRRLRELISTTSQGSVEAKYLETLKKNRELNVKLESERSKTKKLQNQIVALEREKIEDTQVKKGKGVLLPSERPGYAGKFAQQQQSGGFDRTSGSQPDSAREATGESVAALKERLERATKTITTLRRTNEESKREVFRMKKAIALEIGEEQNIERALEAADASIGTNNGNNNTPTTQATATSPPSSSATPNTAACDNISAQPSQPSWRGRAQQISLLKQKIKRLERQLSSAGLVPIRSGETAVGDNASTIAGDDVSTIGGGGASSVATGITTATSRRDFDHVNRELVEKREMGKRQETRELQQTVEQKSTQIDKEKKRGDSFQARAQVLERENQQLRGYVTSIMEKTQNDDKLIVAYKEQLEIQKVETRRAMTANAGGRSGKLGAGSSSSSSSVPTTSALELENSRLKDYIAELKMKVHRLTKNKQQQQQQQPKSSGGSSTGMLPPIAGGGGKKKPDRNVYDDSDDDDECLPQGKAVGGNSNSDGVSQSDLQWLDSACGVLASDPTAALHRARDLIHEQRGTIFVLEDNLQQLERRIIDGVSSLTVKQCEEMIREENSSLKERVKMMRSTMEKEIAMHQAIASQQRSSSSPPGSSTTGATRRKSSASKNRQGVSSTTTSSSSPTSSLPPTRGDGAPPSTAGSMSGDGQQGEMDTQQDLASLKQQYDELRRAYNAQQTKLMKQDSQ